MRSRRKKIIIWILLACFMTCALFMQKTPARAAAKDAFLSLYRQTVYDQESGLGSAEVNCVYQTQSGYIWVGTDGGLYRYNGKEFKTFNLWDTDKDDVYLISSLFQDSTGRLWIATKNYGLFYIRGSEIRHFSDEYYLGVKTINDVCEGANGVVYVATAYGIYTADPVEDSLHLMEDTAGHNIRELSLAGDDLWGLENGGQFFRMNSDGQILYYKGEDYTSDEISCLYGAEDGSVYLGTVGTDVLHMKKNLQFEKMTSGREGINSLYDDGERLFICADSGIGYFDRKGKFTALYDTRISKYFSSMIMDYEGNYWFASNRMGILLLGNSKFRSFNQRYGLDKSGTNCIVEYDGMKYIGTDDGLQILDSKEKPVTNELTESLAGAGVKNVMRDSGGNLWISTSRKYGVICYTPGGEIRVYGRTGALLSNQINLTMELQDKTVAVATQEGISIIGTDGKLVRNYSADNGMDNPNILCMYQDKDGWIYAGSDGSGMYVIKDDVIHHYTDADGLTSNVVTCIYPGEKGLWIGTDNGLSFFSETIRPVNKIDFSNNIYDILSEAREDGNRLWIIGSKGVLCTTEDELLGTGEIKSRYYAQGDGLSSPLTLYSNAMIRKDLLYLCTGQGIYTMTIGDPHTNGIAPKLTVSEINVDDSVYHFDQIGGSLSIPADTQRVSISFAVLSYINRENIQVEYMLEGFDSSPITISPSDPMQAVYTNLEGGNYTFTVRAMNGDGVTSEKDITFTLFKEYGFFEKRAVKIGLLVALILIVFLVVIGMIRFQKRVAGQNREIEKLEKEHEVAVKSSTAKTDFLAHMSNEIKTPVNAIIGLAETVLREQDPEEQKNSLSAIVESGRDILGKVDETIELARLEAGKETVNEAPYSITTLVCDISDQVINALEQRPVRFLVDLGENIPDVMIGDYEKIKRVLEILLDNAQKYTKEGTITLYVDCYESQDPKEKDRLLFSISDTGIGIRKDRLQHIFEVYNIADNKKQTGYTGSGISLAVAKQLVEIMDGDLEVESTYGAGSAFTVSLKQMRPDDDAVTLASGPESLERITREEAERMLMPEVNVLLVDDMEISRTVATGVMKQMEIRSDIATSGFSAVDMVMNQDYDMVFMDLSMPVMSGTDAMHEIREIARDGMDTLPIIAMTEDAIREDFETLVAEGFTDVIVKPLDFISMATMATKYLPKEKIHYRSGDLAKYINESRYADGLTELQKYLDVAGTLERIGGSIEVYNRILSTFYDQNQNSPEDLRIKFSKNYRTFRARLHNVKNGAQNIGATELLNHITRIDAAINIGNKDYVRDHLSTTLSMLEKVIDAIAIYLDFAAGQKGITDEEYAARAAEVKSGRVPAETEKDAPVKKEPEMKSEVDSVALVRMLRAAKEKDSKAISDELRLIRSFRYGTEDTEFLQALDEQIREENMEAILDMIGTYVELKKK